MNAHSKSDNFNTGLPAASEVPSCEPPPQKELVVPNATIPFGGVENIPEELMSKDEQASDELDHAGLDQTLPGEDRAHPIQHRH